MGLEAILVAIAGFVGGFVSTLASNGSSVTLPALDLLDRTPAGCVIIRMDGRRMLRGCYRDGD